MASRIAIRSKFDLKQEDDWERVFLWMLEKGEAFSRAFSTRVRELRLSDPTDEVVADDQNESGRDELDQL